MNAFFLGRLFAQAETISPRQWRILWNWNWPLWATTLAVAVAILWVATLYFRETSSASRQVRALLCTLRLLALALALLMFAQPTLEWFRLAQPRLVLLVDRSASMKTLDHDPTTAANQSRIESWQDLLTSGEQPLVEQWQSTYQLDILAVDQQIKHLTDTTTSLADQLRSLQLSNPALVNTAPAGTRLGDAVDYVLRELPGPPAAALLLFTDGLVTGGQTLEQSAQRARRLRIPLYTIALGSERRPPDMSIENLLVEPIVFPGDRLQVEATVRATSYTDQPAEVILRDTTSNRILDRTSVKLPADETKKSVCLAIRPTEPGNLHLECTLKPLAADASLETNIENNTVRQTVEVRDEKIRVLLVQSQPSYEYRALKSLLERDPAVELRVRLQESDADYHTIDATALSTFPTSKQELFSYDVLLLADADFGLLPRTVWPLLERFVTTHGGGLVCIAGPQFMPHAYRGVRSLERLLPIEFDSLNPLRSPPTGEKKLTVQPTTLGWQTPSLQLGETRAESQAIWQSLPALTWSFRAKKVKPGAQILADANSQAKRLPMILRHYVGAGEVLFHATDETWRWRWRSDDRYFARYWGQVVRRLGRGRLAAGRNGIQLTTDRARYQPEEPVLLQARFRNPAQAAEDQIVAQLQNATDPPRQITLHRHLALRGLFSASLKTLPPGEYQARLVLPDLKSPNQQNAAAVARFAIQPLPRELARVAVDRQALLQAAETTGGKAYTLANVSQLSADLPPPRQQPLDQLPPRPLWKSHLLLALFVATLTTEWLLRRRHGML